MRARTWGLVALALLPGLAAAEPSGESVDKRKFLFRTAIGQNNCPQARDVTETLLADYPDDKGVLLMLAQVWGCEGKWPDAYAELMRARAAGIDVSEVEAQVIAHLAVIDVTVMLDGALTDRSDLAPELAGLDVRPVVTGPGTYRFVLAPAQLRSGEVNVRVPPDVKRLERGPDVRVNGVQIGVIQTVTLALQRVPTVALVRPAGLDPNVTLRLNGTEVVGDVPVTMPAGTFHFRAEWVPPGTWAKGWPQTRPAVEWDQEMAPASIIEVPWTFALVDPHGQLLQAQLLRAASDHVSFDGQTLQRGDVPIHLRGRVQRTDGAPTTATLDIEVPMAKLKGARRRAKTISWGSVVACAASAGGAYNAYQAGQSYAKQARSYTATGDGEAYASDVATVKNATIVLNTLAGTAVLASGAWVYGFVLGARVPDSIEVDVSSSKAPP